MNILTTREENNVIGDGQSDFPVYSTKYINIASKVLTWKKKKKKKVNFIVVHVSTAGNLS